MQLFDARSYLKIDIANSFGASLDKENWDVRIKWFDDNEPELERLIADAETPAMYFAGVQAWRDVQAGKPIGYPISLDACSSNAQIMSALIGDDVTAKLCGVLDTGKREDLYTNIYQKMCSTLGSEGTIKRADVKQAIMTSLFGSEQVPYDVFKTPKVINTFYDTMKKECPHIWELNQVFLDMWDSKALSYNWVLPDNFHVNIKVMGVNKQQVTFLGDVYDVVEKVNKPTKKGKSIGANCTHSIDAMIIRELTRRCSYNPNQRDKVEICLLQHGRDEAEECDGDHMVGILWGHYKSTGYLSARILDHIDRHSARYVDRDAVLDLIESMPKKPFKIMAIHDAVRVLPQYGNDIRKQYNLQLSLIAKSDILSSVVSQILHREVHIGKANEEMWKDILDANYALS